jgi:two-component system, NarL family, response regulator NreC
MPMRKLRIFIADDHVVLREGLAMLIDAQPDMEVVGQAADGRTLVQQTQDCQADVVIMDVSMPGGGAQATAQLRQACPNIHVIALTRHSESGYVRRLLQAGARGYVLKGAGSQELIDAIRAVAAGGNYLDSTLTDRAVHTFVRTQTESSPVPESDLSDREAEVVRLTAYGYTNKEIATQLGVSIKSADTYKARAMEKLGLHSRAGLVRYALQCGWLDET